jgi:D,D-heptose 1,7-bisphosphate phosphatase
MIKQCVILAGGLGTRLSNVNSNKPKALTEVLGEPILENQIKKLTKLGIEEILLLVGYKANEIQNYFGNGSNYGLKIKYIVEKEQLGTGGAIINALPLLDNEFMVIYGDIFFDFSIKKLFDFHKDNKSEASLVVHPNDHPYDSDLVLMDKKARVQKILPSPHPKGLYYENLVNAAAYVFNKSTLLNYPVKKFDIAKELIPRLIKAKKRIFGYRTSEYLKDMGTPDRLNKLTEDILNGKVSRRLANSKKIAVFLDRDGVINHDLGHINKKIDFKLIDGAAEGISNLNQIGYLVIVVTNQPVIARGELSDQGLREIHNKMEKLLGDKRAFIDDLFYCPHHPDSGFEGEVKELKKNCSCRKPGTGMIDAAVKKHNIDVNNSWLIGDRHTDIEAGNKSGLQTILLTDEPKINESKSNLRIPKFTFNNLKLSVKFILKN